MSIYDKIHLSHQTATLWIASFIVLLTWSIIFVEENVKYERYVGDRKLDFYRWVFYYELSQMPFQGQIGWVQVLE